MKNQRREPVISILLLLFTFLIACNAHEEFIAFVKGEAKTMGEMDLEPSQKTDPPSQNTDPLELVFFDCETGESSHPTLLDHFCKNEELSTYRTGATIRSNPCELFAGCYPNGLNLKDFIVVIPAVKPDAAINIFAESGEIVASPSKEYGGSSFYDETTGSMKFTFGVVNEGLFEEQLFLHVKTRYYDGQDNLIEVEDKIEIEKDFLRL